MALPTNAYNSCHTTLRTSLASGTQTTGIILNALIRNGQTVSWPATGGGILRFYRGNQEEHMLYTVATVDATTKDVTLTTGVVRALPWNDGTSITTAGDGIAWPAGTFVDLVLDARLMQNFAKKDVANSFDESLTLANAKKIYFGGGTAAYIGSDNSGADMLFKDTNNVVTTLSQLAAGAGTDTKVRISNNDSTSGFLNGKAVAGAGITFTENNDGSDETLTFSLNSEGDFGDASDGDATVSSPITLSRDMYYNNITGDSIINTANFRLFAKTITGTGAGLTIRCNGSNGGNGGTGGTGAAEVGGTGGTAGTAGAAVAAGYFPATAAGQAGAAGGAGGNRANGGTIGNAGTAGANVTNALNGNGVAGAASGQGGTDSGTAGGAGAAGGAAGTVTTLVGSPRQKISAIQGIIFVAGTATQFKGGAGSGSGAGGGGGGARNSATIAGGGGGGGGGSGSNAGTVSVTVKTLSGPVTFQAVGGNGGNGGAGGTATGAGGGGGGGGSPGNGGIVLVNYRDKSAATVTVSVVAGTPGTGGAAGTPAGDVSFSAAGSNGVAGTSGFSQQLQI